MDVSSDVHTLGLLDALDAKVWIVAETIPREIQRDGVSYINDKNPDKMFQKQMRKMLQDQKMSQRWFHTKFNWQWFPT